MVHDYRYSVHVPVEINFVEIKSYVVTIVSQDNEHFIPKIVNIKKYGSTSYLRIAQVLKWPPIHKV